MNEHLFQVGESWRDELCHIQTCDGPASISVEQDATCAQHASCGPALDGTNVCLCDNGYEGDPYGEACTGNRLFMV